MRLLLALLLITAMFFATAPSWVKEGTVVTYDLLDYNLGSTASVKQIVYTVFSKSGDTIYIETNSQNCRKIGDNTYCPETDTASESFGAFWADSSRLSGTIVPGMNIGGWTVKEILTFKIAGKEFDAVTVEKNVDDVPIKDTYDRKTGLLLSRNITQNNHVTNALFKSINPPLEGASPPPAPTTPPPATTTQPPAQTTTQQPQQTTTTTQPSAQTQQQAIPEEVVIPEIQEPAEPPKRNIPCVPFVFIFGFVAIGIILRKNNY